MPAMREGKTVYDVLPEEFAAEMEQMAKMGASVLGGCCGTTPAYIRKMVARCKPLSPVPVARKGKTIVSSYAEICEIGVAPVCLDMSHLDSCQRLIQFLCDWSHFLSVKGAV